LHRSTNEEDAEIEIRGDAMDFGALGIFVYADG